MARVLVSFPTLGGSVKALTAASLCNLDWGGDEVVYEPVVGCYVDEARRRMAESAIQGKFDYLLMVDSDVVLPSDALVMLREDDVNAVFGWYVRGSSDDGLTNVVKLGSQGYYDSYYAHELAKMAEDHAGGKSGSPLLEAKGDGMGCALVRVDVFDRIGKPWFKFVEFPDGKRLSEDYYFCRKCHEAGLKIYVDTRVGCSHIHDRVLEPR